MNPSHKRVEISAAVPIGQKEVDEQTISYRLHGSEETITVTFDEFSKMIEEKIKNKN